MKKPTNKTNPKKLKPTGEDETDYRIACKAIHQKSYSLSVVLKELGYARKTD